MAPTDKTHFTAHTGAEPPGPAGRKPWWHRRSVLIGAGVGLVLLVVGIVQGGAPAPAPAAANLVVPVTAPAVAPPAAAAAPDLVVPVTAPAVAPPAVATAPAAGATWTMPDLVGSNLQAAQDRIQALTHGAIFFTASHDATGRERHQVLDRNWTVCGQNIAPGVEIGAGTRIDFGAVKVGESC
jgi:hypothetical protein